MKYGFHIFRISYLFFSISIWNCDLLKMFNMNTSLRFFYKLINKLCWHLLYSIKWARISPRQTQKHANHSFCRHFAISKTITETQNEIWSSHYMPSIIFKQFWPPFNMKFQYEIFDWKCEISIWNFDLLKISYFLKISKKFEMGALSK